MILLSCPTSSILQSAAPETQLIVALARAAVGDLDAPAIRQRMSSNVDEALLLQQALRHKVVPMVHHQLRGDRGAFLSATTRDALAQHYHRQFRDSLQIRAELPRLLDRFQARDIEALAFKGPALSAFAYPDENLRTFTDTDLLVPHGDVEASINLLQALGFREKNPMPDRYDTHWSTYYPWQHPHANANGYVRAEGEEGELHVDLHWGLASRYFQFPMDPSGLWARSVSVELDTGAVVPTFSPEDTLLIQCMHTAKDTDATLRHVCDMAAVIRAHPTLDWKSVLERAEHVGCTRMVLVGVYLAHRLLNAALPDPVGAALPSAPHVPSLAGRIMRRLMDPSPAAPQLWHSWAIHLRLRDQWTDALGTLMYTTQLALQPTAADRDWVPMPDRLDGLYYLVRPVRKLYETLTGSSSAARSNGPPSR